ncbi:MAG: epimerase, partial [Gemmatimonadetes bacterium]|nr:epimerase [Gemmatimonadota bacterium]
LTRPLAAGLTYRPLAVTARDTLNWHKTLPAERQARLNRGITAEKEAELLAEWHSTGR